MDRGAWWAAISGVAQSRTCLKQLSSSSSMLLTTGGFPGGSEGKESTRNADDPGSTPVSGKCPGERNDNSFQYSCLGKSHEQRRLEGYSPLGRQESDRRMTKQTHALTI